jgi:hypothetical protein
MNTLRLSGSLAIAALLVSCASERTTFTNGTSVEWQAKRNTEQPQDLAQQSIVVTQTPQLVIIAPADVQPELPAPAQGAAPVSSSAPEPELTASASSDIAPSEDKSVFENLSVEHSTSTPEPGNEKEDANDKTNGMAIAGFVTSLFFPVVGIVLSAIALGQINRKGGRGKGLATAGLIIGIVTTLLIIALI